MPVRCRQAEREDGVKRVLGISDTEPREGVRGLRSKNQQRDQWEEKLKCRGVGGEAGR